MVAAIVMAAGCSSGGGITVGSHGHTAASGPPHPSSSAGAIPNGNQLGQVLSGAHLPAGWKPAPGADNLGTSGATNMAGEGPTAAEYSCNYVDSGGQVSYLINWWSAANASEVLVYPTSGSLSQLTVIIGAYLPGDAAKDMAKAAALMAHCRSFRDPGLDGDPTRTSVQSIPHLGDQNLFLTATEHTKYGTLTGQMIMVRAGNYIVGVDTNTGDDGNVRPATVQGFGDWLLQQLQQAKYLNSNT